MDRSCIMKLILFLAFLVLQAGTMSQWLPPRPFVPKALCASQITLVNHACALLPYFPGPSPSPPSPPSPSLPPFPHPPVPPTPSLPPFPHPPLPPTPSLPPFPHTPLPPTPSLPPFPHPPLPPTPSLPPFPHTPLPPTPSLPPFPHPPLPPTPSLPPFPHPPLPPAPSLPPFPHPPLLPFPQPPLPPSPHPPGRRGRRARQWNPGTLVQEYCCKWLAEIDTQCVCDVLVHLPPFLSRPAHQYTVQVGESCNVTYQCGSRILI